MIFNHYYAHTSKDEKDSYKKVSDQITERDENKNDSTEVLEVSKYILSKGDVQTVTDEDGNDISVSKFDTTFVKVELDKKNLIDYKNNLTEKELKDLIGKATKSYQRQKDIINKEVEKKVKEMTEKQEQIAKIKEEIQKRGFKVEDHYLKYGKYNSSQEAFFISGGYYTLNLYGIFVYENTWENMMGERTTTKRTGTYEVKYSTGDMRNPIQCWVIIFYTKDNEFTARQYSNTWTLVE